MHLNPIRAEIVGSAHCEAEGYVVRAAAPVLAMCRKLAEAGYDPSPAAEDLNSSRPCPISGAPYQKT
jgi:hypothetical protein